MAIPNGYTKIEANKLYENVEYYIDTSVDISYNDYFSSYTSEQPYLYGDLDGDIDIILAYNGSYYKIGRLREYDGSTIWAYDAGVTITNGVININNTPINVLNLNISTSPDWLYVKTAPDYSKVKKVNIIDMDGNEFNFDIGGGAELNIHYGDTAPEDTSKLWVHGATPTKLQISAKNEVSGKIETLSSVLTVSPRHSANATVGDELWIIGGSDAENSLGLSSILVFNMKTHEIRTPPVTLPKKLRYASANAVGAYIYVAGGFSSGTYAETAIYKIDTVNETIETLSTVLPASRCCMGSAVVGKCIYYCGGGVNSGSQGKNIFKFDTNTLLIEQLPFTFQTAVRGLRCVSKGSKIYMVNGLEGATSVNFTNKVRTYDVATQEYSEKSHVLHNSYEEMAVEMYEDKILMFGGKNNTYSRDYIAIYDVTTDTKTTLSIKLPVALTDLKIGIEGNEIYLCGGYKYNNAGQSTTFTSSTAIYKFTALPPVTENTLLLQQGSATNVVSIANNDACEIEVSVKGTYRGGTDGLGQLETSMLYQNGYWQVVTQGRGLIKFYVDGNEYYAKNGWTWGDFCLDEIYSRGKFSNQGSYITYIDMYEVDVNSTDEIIDGNSYTVSFSGYPGGGAN